MSTGTNSRLHRQIILTNADINSRLATTTYTLLAVSNLCKSLSPSTMRSIWNSATKSTSSNATTYTSILDESTYTALITRICVHITSTSSIASHPESAFEEVASYIHEKFHPLQANQFINDKLYFSAMIDEFIQTLQVNPFDQLPSTLLAHTCSYLSKLEISRFKLVCRSISNQCLAEMQKYDFGVFNMHELLRYTHSNKIDLCSLMKQTNGKLIKHTRYKSGVQFRHVIDLWSKQYHIKAEDMMLVYKIRSAETDSLCGTFVRNYIEFGRLVQNAVQYGHTSTVADNAARQFLVFDATQIDRVTPSQSDNAKLTQNPELSDQQQCAESIAFLCYWNARRQRIEFVKFVIIAREFCGALIARYIQTNIGQLLNDNIEDKSILQSAVTLCSEDNNNGSLHSALFSVYDMDKNGELKEMSLHKVQRANYAVRCLVFSLNPQYPMFAQQVRENANGQISAMDALQRIFVFTNGNILEMATVFDFHLPQQSKTRLWKKCSIEITESLLRSQELTQFLYLCLVVYIRYRYQRAKLPQNTDLLFMAEILNPLKKWLLSNRISSNSGLQFDVFCKQFGNWLKAYYDYLQSEEIVLRWDSDDAVNGGDCLSLSPLYDAAFFVKLAQFVKLMPVKSRRLMWKHMVSVRNSGCDDDDEKVSEEELKWTNNTRDISVLLTEAVIVYWKVS